MPVSLSEDALIPMNQPCEPSLHALCARIASRCVWVIQAVLREEERMEARREFYMILREELGKPKPEAEV